MSGAASGSRRPSHGRQFTMLDIDIQLDTADNVFTSFDDARAAGICQACQSHGVHLGLHTLSAVNVAEYSPFVAEAVDRYLRGYVDVYGRLGARWIVVHAGYHSPRTRICGWMPGWSA